MKSLADLTPEDIQKVIALSKRNKSTREITRLLRIGRSVVEEIGKSRGNIDVLMHKKEELQQRRELGARKREKGFRTGVPLRPAIAPTPTEETHLPPGFGYRTPQGVDMATPQPTTQLAFPATEQPEAVRQPAPEAPPSPPPTPPTGPLAEALALLQAGEPVRECARLIGMGYQRFQEIVRTHLRFVRAENGGPSQGAWVPKDLPQDQAQERANLRFAEWKARQRADAPARPALAAAPLVARGPGRDSLSDAQVQVGLALLLQRDPQGKPRYSMKWIAANLWNGWDRQRAALLARERGVERIGAGPSAEWRLADPGTPAAQALLRLAAQLTHDKVEKMVATKDFTPADPEATPAPTPADPEATPAPTPADPEATPAPAAEQATASAPAAPVPAPAPEANTRGVVAAVPGPAARSLLSLSEAEQIRAELRGAFETITQLTNALEQTRREYAHEGARVERVIAGQRAEILRLQEVVADRNRLLQARDARLTVLEGDKAEHDRRIRLMEGEVLDRDSQIAELLERIADLESGSSVRAEIQQERSQMVEAVQRANEMMRGDTARAA